MRATRATEVKLEHSKRALMAEFRGVAPDEIAHRVDEIAHALLESAQFDDYVPVLTHRYTREDLQVLAHAANENVPADRP
jgi:hypothetical protein